MHPDLEKLIAAARTPDQTQRATIEHAPAAPSEGTVPAAAMPPEGPAANRTPTAEAAAPAAAHRPSACPAMAAAMPVVPVLMM